MMHRCPACGADAYWIPEADRLFHADGSENKTCHLSLHRNGQTYPFEQPVTGRSLLRGRAELLAIRVIETEAGTDICLRLDHVNHHTWPDDVPVALKQVTADVVAAMQEEGITPWMPEHPRIRCAPSRAGIYFIRSGDHIKIGQSRDIPARVRELSTGNPVTLRVIACVPIAQREARRDQELAYHRKWADLRVTGTEWFSRDSRLGTWIDGLIYSGIAFDGRELTDV